jgi:glycosidase
MKNLSTLTILACFVFLQTSTFGQTNKVDWSKNATMYEVNIRQYTPEGTFEAFAKHLPRLKKMGVDVIWLMPIHPIGEKNRKGGLGSYYAVKDYKGINPEFGNQADFKALVDQTHNLGMKIIIDWVANHTSPDNVWLDDCRQHWYTLDSAGYLQPTIGTDWWDVADLNFNNPDMRKEMISALEYWVKDFDIDGYRCDVAGEVPTDFWDDARAALDKIKPVFMLAEAELPEHHKKAFDMSYAWEFHHIMNEIAKGKMSLADIHNYFAKNRFHSNDYRLQFTSNHDENSWNGTEEERFGKSRFLYAVLAATIEGMPLVYSGQEADFNRRLLFFEKDQIDWGKFVNEVFYTKLLHLNKNNNALWNGDFGGQVQFESCPNNKDVLVYVREKKGHKVVVFLNFSDKKQDYIITQKFTAGNYKSLFESDKKTSLKQAQTLSLKPLEYKVFYSH